MEKICVAVRVRPEVTEDSSNGNGTFWKVEENRVTLHRALGTPISGVSYAFDHVFDQDCTNARVYELLTKDIIHAAVDGFNGTAFAYGQTSSGKTYTMNGCDSDPGIIHLAVKDIFTETKMRTDREFLIRVSYMEIYNEDINDLLAVENQKLPIHESLERGVFVSGLREEIVNSAEQVLELIQRGEVNRHFGETNMNVRSSRSHTIFRMVIESKGKETGSGDNSSSDDVIRVSVLNLVDLAGSERITKTGAGGVRLKEGKHINRSLLILGNVINKLSEGGKQRGHIPYRDSKLTRILQPALGGNAKTSIICTVAPEEAHIEETKGTLQFASRAKRITNCVQVNEILTDAALLKRQKLEIEELRMKLQGSRAEVLEQEILKLRNDMLKYELQHEKLAMELEEERRSHKERDQCIREQQMKIENLSSLVTFSGSERGSTQECNKVSLKEESCDSRSFCEEDGFRTPCFKAVPNSFVVRRSRYSKQPDYSPLPDTFNDFADEDTWMRMNKGYIADLDSLHKTPARKVQSFPSGDDSSVEDYKQEMQDLRRQLALVLKDRDDLKRHYVEQISVNNQLMREVSNLQKEVTDIQEIPRRMCESVVDCKNIYADVLSVLESFVADEKSAAAKLLSGTRDIGTCLFSTLESHFSLAVVDGGDRFPTIDKSLFTEQCSHLCERMKSTISSIVVPDASFFEEDKLTRSPLDSCKYKDRTLREEIASWKEKLDSEVKAVMEKQHNLKTELSKSNQLLEVTKQRYHTLEREYHDLKEEKDSLLSRISNSSQILAMVNDEKEKALQDLKMEAQRRNDLEEKMRMFSTAFSYRQKSFASFQSDFQSTIESLKHQNLVSVSNPHGSFS